MLRTENQQTSHMDKLYNRPSLDSTGSDEHLDHNKDNPLHSAQVEPCALHRVTYGANHSVEDETFFLHPLKREVLVVKEPSQDFGTSLCLLHGDVFVTDVREHRYSARQNEFPHVSDFCVNAHDTLISKAVYTLSNLAVRILLRKTHSPTNVDSRTYS